MRIVIFDFDGTLTKKDTLRPFATYFANKYRCYHKLFLFYVFLALYRLNLTNDKSLKEIFLRFFIRGISKTEIEDVVNSFLESKLGDLLDNAVFEKLKKHISSGDEVYIASANFDFFLEPLIKKWGVNGIISTQTEEINGYFTSKIMGDSCKRENKLKKLESVLGAEELKKAIVYGDEEDFYLLNVAKQGVKICRRRK